MSEIHDLTYHGGGGFIYSEVWQMPIMTRRFHIRKINEFLEYKEDKNPKMNYLSYIRQKHNNFFTKLITCVPCYNFWIVLLVVILFNSIYLYPLIYLTSYSLYKILKKYVY